MTITPDAVVDVHAGSDTSLSSMAVAKVLHTSQIRKVIGIHMGLVRDEILERAKGGKYRLRDPGRYDAPICSTGTRRTLLPTNKQEIVAGERRKAAAKRAKIAKETTAEGTNASKPLSEPQPEIKAAEKSAEAGLELPNGTIPVDKPCKTVDKSVDKPVMSKSVIKRLAVQKDMTLEEIRQVIKEENENHFAEDLETNLSKLVDPPVTTLEEIEAKVDEEKSVKAALCRLEKKIKSPAVVIPELPNADMKEAMLCKLEAIMEDSIATECRELRAWMDEVFKLGRLDK